MSYKNNKDFKLIKKYENYLTKQQYKTLRGQLIAGDNKGAIKGLQKILRREQDKVII